MRIGRVLQGKRINKRKMRIVKYTFHEGNNANISFLREKQILDLKGQIFDPLEEKVRLDSPLCIEIQEKNKRIGYALIDTKENPEKTILEFYLLIEYRKDAKFILNELIRNYKCTFWYVNTQDSFSLPLMIECGYPSEIDGFIFSINDEVRQRNTPDLTVKKAVPDDLDAVYELIMQDGFFTGAGKEDVLTRIRTGEIFLLYSSKLIGVGFVSPLLRTPDFADIAMIIDKDHRRQGYATQLVDQLIKISFQQNLRPTALTSETNIASRKTLQKCGFYVDGCMLLSKLTKGTESF